jgi:hypothetical protein
MSNHELLEIGDRADSSLFAMREEIKADRLGGNAYLDIPHNLVARSIMARIRLFADDPVSLNPGAIY